MHSSASTCLGWGGDGRELNSMLLDLSYNSAPLILPHLSDRQKQRNALVATDTRKAQADPSETCTENSDVSDVSTQTEQERTSARRNASARFVNPQPCSHGYNKSR